MNRADNEREVVILEVIREAGQPVGSWNLVELLAARGMRLGASTVGRALNHLEKQGYLSKSNVNQGRTLTDKGRTLLGRVERDRHLRPLSEQLGEVVESQVLENYLMVLEARKVIERGTARLAAEHISEEELRELERLVQQREESYRRGGSVISLDVAFHTTIARASRNEVLRLLYQTIATFGQQSPRFEYLRRRIGAPFQESHREILEALRAHDAGRAEQGIVLHIDALIRDVKSYWHEFLG